MANGEPAIRPSTEAEVPERAMDRLENIPPLLLTLEYPMRRPPILKIVHATDDRPPASVVAPLVKYLQEIWRVLDRHRSATGRCYAVRFFSQSFT